MQTYEEIQAFWDNLGDEEFLDNWGDAHGYPKEMWDATPLGIKSQVYLLNSMVAERNEVLNLIPECSVCPAKYSPCLIHAGNWIRTVNEKQGYKPYMGPNGPHS